VQAAKLARTEAKPRSTYSSISLTLQGEIIFMKLTKMLICASTLALGIASAASGYKVNLPNKMWVGSTELKAGDYRVEVTGNKAVFKMGKETIEVPATLQTSSSKFAETELDATQDKLKEIHVGGTTSKIVFSSGGAPGTAAQ
jgi:hypothetical protein